MAEHTDTGSNSPWRILLTFAILIIALIRLVATCSKTNQAAATLSPEMEKIQERQNAIMERQRDRDEASSNRMMYAGYKELDKSDASLKRLYGFGKVQNDSIVHFDLSSDLKVEHGFYFQNNRDDSLKIAMRTPEMSIFFHDFTNNRGDEYNMHVIKQGLHLDAFKPDKIEKLKAYSYTIKYRDKSLNGYVISMGDKDYASYAEFESETLGKTALRAKALIFLITHIKATKKTDGS